MGKAHSLTPLRVVDVFADKPSDDPTLLTVVFKQTELVGLMQLLYAILLSGGPPRHSHSPPLLTQHTQAISIATIKTLNNAAILDLKMVQVSVSLVAEVNDFNPMLTCLLTCYRLNRCIQTVILHHSHPITQFFSLQACLGAEGISLEFRHIVNYLLWWVTLSSECVCVCTKGG